MWKSWRARSHGSASWKRRSPGCVRTLPAPGPRSAWPTGMSRRCARRCAVTFRSSTRFARHRLSRCGLFSSMAGCWSSWPRWWAVLWPTAGQLQAGQSTIAPRQDGMAEQLDRIETLLGGGSSQALHARYLRLTDPVAGHATARSAESRVQAATCTAWTADRGTVPGAARPRINQGLPRGHHGQPQPLGRQGCPLRRDAPKPLSHPVRPPLLPANPSTHWLGAEVE